MKLIDDDFHRQMRKGFLRLAILKFISDGPTYGYKLIQQIKETTCGEWTPSPGSIYPILAELEKEGLIFYSIIKRRKIYNITPAGLDTLQEVFENLRNMHKELLQLFGEAMFNAVQTERPIEHS